MMTETLSATVQTDQLKDGVLVVGEISIGPGMAAPTIPLKDYMLTIRQRFPATDDLEAREAARTRLVNMLLAEPLSRDLLGIADGDEIRLQEVRKDGPPRKVEI